jgi:hypothetical protein
MITRAGYPTVVEEMDEDLIAAKLPDVESKALAMIQARAG